MKWPWKRDPEAEALNAEAEAKTAEAKREYEKTLQNKSVVADALAALLYHAEQNHIVENIQRVARGH